MKDKIFMFKLLFFIFLFVLFFVSSSFAGEYRLTTLNKSYHYDKKKEYNESHNGIGVEYQTSDNLWIGIMTYNNSFNETSTLLSFNKEYRTGTNDLYVGTMGGIAFGYDPYLPMAGFTVRYKILRLIVIPSVASVGFVYEFN